MIIQLTEDRRLSSDNRQFQLDKLTMKKGEPVWVSYAYYGTLSNAIKSVPETLLRESDATGLREVLSFLRRIEKQLLGLIGEG